MWTWEIGNCFSHDLSFFCHHHLTLVSSFQHRSCFSHSASSAVKWEIEVKQAGSHLMYFCHWMTWGLVISILLCSINMHTHPCEGTVVATKADPFSSWLIYSLAFKMLNKNVHHNYKGLRWPFLLLHLCSKHLKIQQYWINWCKKTVHILQVGSSKCFCFYFCLKLSK